MKMIVDQFDNARDKYTPEGTISLTDSWGPIWRRMAQLRVDSINTQSINTREVILFVFHTSKTLQ